MNIMKMSDEELAVELRKIGEANNATVIHGGQQMWSIVSKFIRQCVKDSQTEGLTTEEITEIVNKHVPFIFPDDITNLAAAIHAAQERNGLR